VPLSTRTVKSIATTAGAADSNLCSGPGKHSAFVPTFGTTEDRNEGSLNRRRLHSVAAADEDGLAGHPPRLLRRQEHDDVGHFFGGADPSERDRREQAPF